MTTKSSIASVGDYKRFLRPKFRSQQAQESPADGGNNAKKTRGEAEGTARDD